MTNGYNIGLTSSGNPNLKPEKSTGYTLGAVFQPKRNLTFTVDMWRTKIKDLIVPQSVTNEILAAYYTTGNCNSIPNVICNPGTPDGTNPAALPRSVSSRRRSRTPTRSWVRASTSRPTCVSGCSAVSACAAS